MNEHDATEIAFKNGYMKAVEDIKKYLTPHKMGLFNYNYIDFVIDDLKKKCTES